MGTRRHHCNVKRGLHDGEYGTPVLFNTKLKNNTKLKKKTKLRNNTKLKKKLTQEIILN